MTIHTDNIDVDINIRCVECGTIIEDGYLCDDCEELHDERLEKEYGE